ncbi:hypothetical protein SAMN04489841_1093 [Natrinema salaciae]|uniref:Uncharacterized protein n=1 Tax=Natrinema salaciae TaxID=1186196 RepID=A0A1H9CLX6_9EURY|nr:hypothetical protein SAMN04489841_1093 [Natrinema salaciae]
MIIPEGRFTTSDGLPIRRNSQLMFKKLVDIPILVFSNIAQLDIDVQSVIRHVC